MTPEERAQAINKAIAKYLKLEVEDILNVGFIKESPDGQQNMYMVMVADRRPGQRVRGKRVLVPAVDIGRADDLVKQIKASEEGG